MKTILDDVKSFCEIDSDFYDNEVISEINSAFYILYDNGIGTTELFYINDNTATWDMFISSAYIHPVSDYIKNKVRLYFDPPRNEYLTNMRNKKLDELLYRLRCSYDRLYKEAP